MASPRTARLATVVCAVSVGLPILTYPPYALDQFLTVTPRGSEVVVHHSDWYFGLVIACACGAVAAVAVVVRCSTITVRGSTVSPVGDDPAASRPRSGTWGAAAPPNWVRPLSVVLAIPFVIWAVLLTSLRDTVTFNDKYVEFTAGRGCSFTGSPRRIEYSKVTDLRATRSDGVARLTWADRETGARATLDLPAALLATAERGIDERFQAVAAREAPAREAERSERERKAAAETLEKGRKAAWAELSQTWEAARPQLSPSGDLGDWFSFAAGKCEVESRRYVTPRLSVGGELFPFFARGDEYQRVDGVKPHGGRLLSGGHESRRISRFAVDIDPAADPHTIDFTDDKGRRLLGIYRITSEKGRYTTYVRLHLAVGANRPDRWKSGDGVFTYELMPHMGIGIAKIAPWVDRPPNPKPAAEDEPDK